MADENQDGKQVSWRISDELRARINFKAQRRGQTAEEFVIECMEKNTEELKDISKQIATEKRAGKKPAVLSSRQESKAKGSG